MKPHFTYPNTYISLFFLIFTFYSSVLSAPIPDSATPIKVARDNLISKYDSLDLKKQEFKRIGLSIVDLEIQQDSIRDSLKILQQIIQNPSSISKPISGTSSNLSIFKPKSTFDWVILIIGIIALFSGVLLLYGIFSMISAKFKRQVVHKKKPNQVKAVSNKGQSAPITQSIAALRALSESSGDPVTKLRQQIQTTEISKAPNSPDASFSVPASPPNKENDSTTSKNRHETALHQKVVSAADSGMSHFDISRTFHISADHVALILKVAGKKR